MSTLVLFLALFLGADGHAETMEPKGAAPCETAFGEVSHGVARALEDLKGYHNGWKVAEAIESYGLTTEDEYFAVAMAIAQRGGGGLASNIKKFKISDPERRYQLAMAAGPSDAYSVGSRIADFEIMDVQKRFEIAKECAKDNGLQIGENIQNFGLKSERMRFEVAKAAAQSKRQGWDVLKHLKNYKLTNEYWIMEVARLAIESSAYSSVGRLGKLGLKDKAKILKLIRQVLRPSDSNPVDFSRVVAEVPLTDQDALYEFALVNVEHWPSFTAFRIKNFRISDETRRFEIAKRVYGSWAALVALGSLADFKLTPEH